MDHRATESTEKSLNADDWEDDPMSSLLCVLPSLCALCLGGSKIGVTANGQRPVSCRPLMRGFPIRDTRGLARPRVRSRVMHGVAPGRLAAPRKARLDKRRAVRPVGSFAARQRPDAGLF